MKAVAVYFFNAIVWWLMVVGGMCLAGIIAADGPYYGLAVGLGILPSMLFLKFRLPTAWHQFAVAVIVVFLIGVVYFVLAQF